MTQINQRKVGEQVLIVTTAMWGTTFLVTQDALAQWPPFLIMASRFGVAAAILLPLGMRRALTPALWREGAWVGFFAFFGFSLQTVSLQFTTQAHCAFGTALVTVLVPPLCTLLWRSPWRLSTSLAILSAAGGTALLLGGRLEPGMHLGDVLAVLGAVAFAGQVVLLGVYARRRPLLPLVAVEVTTVALLSAAFAAWRGESLPPQLEGWERMVYLGVVATAAGMFGQVFGQARTSATRAAFVYALEPIFAAAFAWALRGQGLSLKESIGGALVVFAAVIADRPSPAFARSRTKAVPPGQPHQDADDAHRPSPQHARSR